MSCLHCSLLLVIIFVRLCFVPMFALGGIPLPVFPEIISGNSCWKAIFQKVVVGYPL